MFSTGDVGKSKVFKSVTLINTVTCVKFVGRFLLAGKSVSGFLPFSLTYFPFAGVGNVLLVYDTDSRQSCGQRKIFDKATIHGVRVNAKGTLVAIHGEKYVAIYKLETEIGFLLVKQFWRFVTFNFG